MLGELFRAGVDVFRLNASQGKWEEHQARIRAVRDGAREAGADAGILLDLQGLNIRPGCFEGGGCTLPAGAHFTITTEPVAGTCEQASTGYLDFARDAAPGHRILLADGAIELRALESDGVRVRTEVVRGGAIADQQGINLPGVAAGIPSLTDKDLAGLDRGLNAGVDMVALSFVRSAADGVMVARGDLGVETALEKVPRIQRSIIRRACRKGRFVITATQMLESTIERPMPTRAEVSDVAHAIYDGTGAVMLSAETSIGRYIDRRTLPRRATPRFWPMPRIAPRGNRGQRPSWYGHGLPLDRALRGEADSRAGGLRYRRNAGADGPRADGRHRVRLG